MRALFLSLVLLSGCASSQSLQACAEQVGKDMIVPAITDAVVCGEDTACIEDSAKTIAVQAANKLLICTNHSSPDGGIK